MNKRLTLTAAATLICGYSLTSSANADVITLQEGVSPTGAYDQIGGSLRSNADDATGNYTVGRFVSGSVGRATFGWDISAIPLGSTINSVTLTVNVGSAAGSDPGETGLIELFEVNPNSDGAVFGEGVGTSFTAVTTGDAWDTAGGNLAGPALDSEASFDTGGTLPANLVFSGPSLIALAQDVLDGTNTGGNNDRLDLILKLQNESPTGTRFLRLDSDNHSPNSDRPTLVIDFTAPNVPEPGSLSLALLGIGSLMMLNRTRRQRR